MAALTAIPNVHDTPFEHDVQHQSGVDQTPQRPIIITQPSYLTTNYPNYRGKFAKILGGVQISAAILSIIFNIAGIPVDAGLEYFYFPTFYMVPGIWSGTLVSTLLIVVNMSCLPCITTDCSSMICTPKMSPVISWQIV